MKPLKNRLGPAAGYIVAVLALVWVFYDIHPASLFRHYSSVNWWLACVGMLVDIGRYVSQSIRWKLLLSAFCEIPVIKTLKALYTGVFLNMIFPLRIGEVARAFVVSRNACSPFSSIVSSLFVEYLFDGIWLAVGIGLSTLLTPLPHQIVGAARILGVAIVCAVAVFCFLVFREMPVLQQRMQTSHGPFRAVILRLFILLHKMHESIHVISRSRFFGIAFIVSAANLFFHMSAFWIILNAYGIHLPFFTAAAVMLFVFVGLIIPNAPSNVGSFQFFCVIALMAVGIDKTQAAGFSLLVFILVSTPQLAIGSIAFILSGRTLSEIKKEVRRLRRSA